METPESIDRKRNGYSRDLKWVGIGILSFVLMCIPCTREKIFKGIDKLAAGIGLERKVRDADTVQTVPAVQKSIYNLDSLKNYVDSLMSTEQNHFLKKY